MFNSSASSAFANNLEFSEIESFSSEIFTMLSSGSNSISLMSWFLENSVPSFSDFFVKAKEIL